MENSLKRKCPGLSCSLGDLYDVRSEQQKHVSIFIQNLPQERINSTKRSHTKYEYIKKDTYKEKFSKLDVNAELKLDIFSGSLKLSGSGNHKLFIYQLN